MRKGRKAGPKRIDPDTIAPSVWVAEEDGTAFLVCNKRHYKYRPITGGPREDEGAVTVEALIHGAAIRMPPDVEILLGFQITEGTWRRTPPEDHGLSRRCAQVALAEAWHGVNVTLDSATWSVYITGDGEAWRKYKKGVRIRNLAIAMHWDQWERDDVPLETRSELLTQSGFPCTAKQLARFAEDRGL